MLLTTTLTINSALLAVLLLLSEFGILAKPSQPPAHLPRIAGAKTIKLENQSVQLVGNGRVVATGNLALAGRGAFAVTTNGEYVFVNGQLSTTGKILQSDGQAEFRIEGEAIFAEFSGQPLKLTATGSGSLTPDIEATSQVAD